MATVLRGQPGRNQSWGTPPSPGRPPSPSYGEPQRFFDVFCGCQIPEAACATAILGSACVSHAVFGVPPNTFRPVSPRPRPNRSTIHCRESAKKWGAGRAPPRPGRSRSPILAVLFGNPRRVSRNPILHRARPAGLAAAERAAPRAPVNWGWGATRTGQDRISSSARAMPGSKATPPVKT